MISPHFSQVPKRLTPSKSSFRVIEEREQECLSEIVTRDGQGQIIVIRGLTEPKYFSQSKTNLHDTKETYPDTITMLEEEAHPQDMEIKHRLLCHLKDKEENRKPGDLVGTKLERIERDIETVNSGCCPSCQDSFYHFRRSIEDMFEDYETPIRRIKRQLIKEGILVEAASLEDGYGGDENDQRRAEDKSYQSILTTHP